MNSITSHIDGMGDMEPDVKCATDGGGARWATYFLPGVVLSAVLIGGGYATGREIVEYGAKFGALGWVGGVGVFFGFLLMSYLVFEFARRFRVYDYRAFLQGLIGRWWYLYDVVFLVMALIVIAVVASAAGEILQYTMNIPYILGVAVMIGVVATLIFYGEWIIERYKSVVTLLLIGAYLLFGISVIAETWGHASQVFDEGRTGYVEGDWGLGLVVWTGILYVGYNLVVYPASLFTLRRLQTHAQSVAAAIISGILMCLPWFFTYFALMGFYPSESVIGAEVPWLVMLEDFGVAYLSLFGIVVGLTLIATATGLINAFLGRLQAQLQEVKGRAMTSKENAGVALGALVIAVALAQIGIIDLIARGYMVIAYAMITVFAVPLLTVGVYRIVREGGSVLSPDREPKKESATGRTVP